MTGAPAPIAEKRPQCLSLHGRERHDDYAWMRDDRWQEVLRDPTILKADIRAHLEAENAHTADAMAATADLQETLFQEMKGRIKEDDSSVPAPDGAYDYYTRYDMGGQHPILCRRPRGEDGPEQILLYGDKEAEGHEYFDLGDGSHSPDHKYLVYGTDTQGSEYYTLRIRDLTTGEDLPDRIESTSGYGVWANDAKTILYVKRDDHNRPSSVWRHTLGEDPAQDTLIYKEDDPSFYVGVGKTESDKFFVISSGDHQTTESRLIDADAPESAPVLVCAREGEHLYSISHHGENLLIQTNTDGAEDFKLMIAPANAPERKNWRDLIPHKPGCLQLGVTPYKSFLVRMERENGLPRLIVTRLNDKTELGEEHTIAFDEEAYALGMDPGLEFDTKTLRFSYSSPTTPSQQFDYDMETRERVLRKTQEIPSGHDPKNYVTKRILVSAPDGETVPVTLLYAKTTPTDGSAPVMLYGYGSYGHALPAAFNSNRLSLVDRGFIDAIAHVRGGMEKGFRWYKDGKLMKKRNTFTDFIAAAEGLIEHGYATRGNILIQGGSAGGLLVGAAMNMAPDLFKAVIAEVPFVDVLNTICDASLPLTPPEWTEWGNPIESVEAYDYIASYSPYDNVEAKAYPHLLATAGLSDPRVTYWEPAKWIARLREVRTDDRLCLLKTYMEAGHGGAAGRFERLREVAQVYAFAMMVTER